MSGLNLFKRSSDKPRTSIRERLRNTAARILPRVRKARAGGGTDPARRAVLVGSLASTAMASLPAAAAAGGDAVLLDAWERYQAAMARNDAMNARIRPLFEASLASLPPHMERSEFLALSEEEQEAYREQRNALYPEAFDKHGVLTLEKEQEHFFETVVDPLAETIRNTAPTTLQGAAIKARYLLESENSSILRAKDIRELDLSDAALRLLIEQLAALA